MGEIWRAALSVPPNLGGKEVHVWELSVEQAKTDPVRLLYAWGSPKAAPNIKSQRVWTLPRHAPAVIHASVFAVSVAARVWGHQRKQREIRLLHIHGDAYEAAVMAIFWTIFPLVPPMVLTVHGRPAKGRMARLAWRIARRKSSSVIAVSSAVKADLEQLLGEDASIVVQSSGVRAPFFRTTWSGSPSQVVSAGVLSSRRDFETLLRGVALSSTKPPLRIFGDGPDRAALEELAVELKLDARFGPTSDPAEIAESLSSAVYVHARSRIDEGFPTAVLEALAVGAPVVVPEFASASDYLKPGGNALPYRDAAGIADAIDGLFHLGAALTVETRVPSWLDVADALQELAGDGGSTVERANQHTGEETT